MGASRAKASARSPPRFRTIQHSTSGNRVNLSASLSKQSGAPCPAGRVRDQQHLEMAAPACGFRGPVSQVTPGQFQEPSASHRRRVLRAIWLDASNLGRGSGPAILPRNFLTAFRTATRGPDLIVVVVNREKDSSNGPTIGLRERSGDGRSELSGSESSPGSARTLRPARPGPDNSAPGPQRFFIGSSLVPESRYYGSEPDRPIAIRSSRHELLILLPPPAALRVDPCGIAGDVAAPRWTGTRWPDRLRHLISIGEIRGFPRHQLTPPPGTVVALRFPPCRVPRQVPNR